ncbi:MAG: ECF transporter S component [Caloramator sp.]|nr:ECF transporter S component [Caloramator sp.]
MISKTNKIVYSSLLLAIGIVFQIIGRNIPQINQFLVGPIINSILILTAFICGRWWGVGVGTLTPLLAWFVGQLATPLAPFIPFIILGNLLFVLVFSLFMEGDLLRRATGIVLGALAKFAFLTFASTKLIKLVGFNFPPKIAKVLATSMSFPQLITALLGGALALVVIELLKKRRVI